ncbi:hypothetical protein F5Y15DRAFT_418203 [Xylariaceae sp. FL0016]|nr:hypothetical protein F5Y15DRAFT_418203 [Xylariaceae sp. FL0016]
MAENRNSWRRILRVIVCHSDDDELADDQISLLRPRSSASAKGALSVTLHHRAHKSRPVFLNLPVRPLLRLWRPKASWAADVQTTADETTSNASTETLTSQAPGNARYECGQLVDFICENDADQSVMILARADDPMDLSWDDMSLRALSQVTGPLVGRLAYHAAEVVDASMLAPPEGDLDVGASTHHVTRDIETIRALPPLVMRDRDLLLVIDLSDVPRTNQTSWLLDRLIDALKAVTMRNNATMLMASYDEMGNNSIMGSWGEVWHPSV